MMASVPPSQGVGMDSDMASSLALLKKKNAHLRSKTRSHLDMNEDFMSEKPEERGLVRSQSVREPAAHRREDGGEDLGAGANAPRPKVSAKVGALPDCFQTAAGGRVSRASRTGGRRRESNVASRPATPTDTTGSEAEGPPRVQRHVQVGGKNGGSGAHEEIKDTGKAAGAEPVPSPVPVPVQKPVPPQGAQTAASTPSRKRSVVSAILNQISKHTPFSFGSSNGASNASSREPSVGRSESNGTHAAEPTPPEKKATPAPANGTNPATTSRTADRSLERMKADEAAEKRKREAADELERAEAIVQQQLAQIEQERQEEVAASRGVTSRRKVSTYTDEELDDIMEEPRSTRRLGRTVRREVAAPVPVERGSFRSNHDGKVHGRAVPKRDAVSSERSGDDDDKAYLRRRRSSIPSTVPGPPPADESLKNERERRMEARRSRKQRGENEIDARAERPKRSRSKGRARREREKEHERIVSNIENEMGLSSSTLRPQSPAASDQRPPRPEKKHSDASAAPDPMAVDPMGRPRTNISAILSEARQTTRTASSTVTHSTGLPKPKNLATPPLPDEAKPKSSVAKQIGGKGLTESTEKDEAPRTAPPSRLQPKPSAQANANGKGGDGERRPITTDSILRGSLANSISQARSTVSVSQARGEGGKKLPPSRLPLYNNGGAGTGGVKKPPGVLKSSTWSAGDGAGGAAAGGGSSAQALMASYAEVAEGLDKLRGKMKRGNSLRCDAAPLPAISEKGSARGSSRDQNSHRSAVEKADEGRDAGAVPAPAPPKSSARAPGNAAAGGGGEIDKENRSKSNGDRDDNSRATKKQMPKPRMTAGVGSQSGGSGDDGPLVPSNTKTSPPKRRVLKRDRSKDKSPGGARPPPAAAPVPAGPKTEEDILMELCGKQMEIESVMRVKVRDAKDYESAHGAFVSLSRFLSQVSQLANLLGVSDGIVYQELLARSVGVNLDARGGQCFDDMKSDGFLPMHQAKVLDRSERLNETLGADLDVILSKNSDVEPLSNLVHYATELRTMLKVKVEDANDLKMASMVIHDGEQFFNTVSTMAADKGVRPIAFFEDLRKM